MEVTSLPRLLFDHLKGWIRLQRNPSSSYFRRLNPVTGRWTHLHTASLIARYFMNLLAPSTAVGTSFESCPLREEISRSCSIKTARKIGLGASWSLSPRLWK